MTILPITQNYCVNNGVEYLPIDLKQLGLTVDRCRAVEHKWPRGTPVPTSIRWYSLAVCFPVIPIFLLNMSVDVPQAYLGWTNDDILRKILN